MNKKRFTLNTLYGITTLFFLLSMGCVTQANRSKAFTHKTRSSSQKTYQTPLDYSPSGKFLAHVKKKSVLILDPSTGNILHTITPKGGKVFSLSFDPYEKHLALGMYRSVQIWDFENKRLVKSIPAHTDIVTKVQFDPTGAILATASKGADQTINFWDTTNWQHKNTLSMKNEDGYANNIQAMSFSQNGQYFSSTGLDKKILVWNARTGKKKAVIKNESPITSIALSPNGDLVAAGDKTGKLHVWKVGTQEHVAEGKADTSPIQKISFNRNGDFLATAGNSNIRLWDTSNWEFTKNIGFNKPDVAIVFNPGNLAALVLTSQGTVSLYELTNQNVAQPIIKPSKALPPMISVLSPEFGAEVKKDHIRVAGKVQGAVKIEKITIFVNGNPLAEDTRDLSISSSDDRHLPFDENVYLTQEGTNEIKISAVDINGLVTTEIITVKKISAEGKVWGAVIGISKYQNDDVNELKYAASDAQSFYRYLRDDYGILEENLFLLTDADATNRNIRDLLGVKLKKVARKEDTVFIYYAGHGAPEIDSSVSDGSGAETYYLPYDADPNSLYSTALPMEEVSKIMSRIKSQRVAFIADTCFSGASSVNPGRRTRSISKDVLSRLTKTKGRVVLAASESNERSIEDDTLKAGVFTYYLLKGLKGVADSDHDGFITIDETFNYLSKHVPDATDQEQHPKKEESDVRGQIILGKVKN